MRFRCPVALLWLPLLLGAACSRQALVVVSACIDGGTTGGACIAPGGDGSAESVDAASSLRNGLVGLWHLDEPPGSMVAMDSSGTVPPNNGTLKELDPATAWVEGQLGGALDTRGLGYVLVPLSPSIEAIKTQVTVAAWVYLQGTIVATEYGTAISRQIGATIDQYYHVALAAEAVPAGFIIRTVPKPAFFRQLLGTKPVRQMTWSHLAVTYDGANARLYVDGAQVDEKPITGTFGADTTPLILGGNQNEGVVTERFPGRIDEIVLYNRALTASEISALAGGMAF